MSIFQRIYHVFAMRNPDGFGADWIRQHSLTEDDIFARLEGKSVAVIGNARALLQTRQGAEIDAHDIVLRINEAPALGTPGGGSKLDWIATSMPTRHDNTPTVLWIGRKVRKIPYSLMTSGRLFVYSRMRRDALSSDLSARASTGIMVVELLLRSPASSIELYGFDFYASRSLSGDHTIDTTPHAYDEERKWVMQRMAGDARLAVHPMGPVAGA